MKQLIILISTAKNEYALADFFAQAEQHIPEAVFIVLDPSKEADTTIVSATLAMCSNMPIINADIDVAMQDGNIFVLSANKNILLNNGFFVSHNTMAQKAMPFLDAFCYSISKCSAYNIAVVLLEVAPAIETMLLANKRKCAILACSFMNAQNNTSLDETYNYDLVLPIKDLPAAIAQRLSTAKPNSPNTNDYSAAQEPQTNLKQIEYIQQDDFDDLLQHLRTAVLYLNNNLNIRRFSNFLQHYLPLDDSALGKSINQINTNSLSPEFNQWIKNVVATKIPLQKDIALSNGESCDLKIVPLYYANAHFKGIMVSITDTTSNMRVQRILDFLSQELHSQGTQFWKERQKVQESAKNQSEIVANFEQQHDIWNNITETMNEGIIATNEKHEIIYINKNAREMTNLKLGSHVTNWLNTHNFYLLAAKQIPIPNEQNPIIRALEGHYTNKEDIDIYVTSKNSNTKEGFLNIHTQILPHTNINPNGILIVLRDINERKSFEIELQESELQQKALLLALPDSMFHIDRQGKYLNYIPAKNEEQQDKVFFKYEPAFFIGNRIQDILPDMGNDIMQMFENAMQTQEVQTRAFKSHQAERIHHYDVRLSLVNHNEALVLMRDITEVIACRYIADRYGEYYQILLENSIIPVVWIDTKGSIVYANSKVASLGFEKQSIINKNVLDYLLPTHRLRAQTALENAFKETTGKIGKYKIQVANNAPMPVKVKASIIIFNQERLLQVTIGIKKIRNK